MIQEVSVLLFFFIHLFTVNVWFTATPPKDALIHSESDHFNLIYHESVPIVLSILLMYLSF